MTTQKEVPLTIAKAAWEEYDQRGRWAWWQESQPQPGLLYTDEPQAQRRLANDCAREAKEQERRR